MEAGPAPDRKQPLYGQFFGLNEPPFDLTPNARFLFLANHLREALSNIRYGLATSKGLTVLLGEAGTGKTTLIRAAVTELDNPHSRYVLLSNPTLNKAEFYEFLAREMGFSARAGSSKASFLAELQADVDARFKRGGLTGLIVDEAQSMPYELLEEIRLLGNIETMTSKLLNIVLSGQPELADRLNESRLRQLKQRVALRCELRPLTRQETFSYVAGRLRIAGGTPEQILTAEAVIAIFEASGGIPRWINVLCDNALISGYAAKAKPITARVVADVCRDFDVRSAGPASNPDAPANEAERSANSTPASDRKANAKAAVERTASPVTDREMFRAIQDKPRFSYFR
jgi:general secretion pathway protein A